MKLKNVFYIWFWANIMLLFCGFIYYLFVSHSFSDVLSGMVFITVIGIMLTIPSLVVLTLFQFVYSSSKKSKINNFYPYLNIILFINFIYLMIYQAMGGYQEIEGILFFFLTTFCGIMALFIENDKVKKSIPKIGLEEIL